VYYGVAWLAFPALCVLRLRPFGLPELLVLRQAFITLFFLGAAGSLLEHVRADRRRYGDARRLLEQWRHTSGLSRQRANELEVLAGITAQLVASLELRQVLRAVVDHALRLAGADSVSVYLIDGETGTLRGQGLSAVAGPRAATDPPAPRPRGLTAAVGRSGEAAFVEEVAAHPLFQDGARPPLGALAAVPLKLNGRVVGVLNAAFRKPRAFDADDRRMLLALADVSALAIHNATQHERLARLAVTDDLTGLPNRRRFLEALRAEAQRARRYQRALSLVMLDLDGLKDVNDRHGHAAGDAVLRGVAQALRAGTRDTDLPVRLSGDEFAVLLPETEPEAALRIAERIRAGVAALQVPVDGGTAGATVSLGLVSAEGAALPELPRFLRLADEALYAAKAAGRNRIVAAEAGGSKQPAVSSGQTAVVGG
jgi:diguanylate cyclase (GGDEF)-like protein